MNQSFWHGILAGLGLLSLYVVLLYVLNGPAHVLEQFKEFGFLIALMVSGFGIQVGLFSYALMHIRHGGKEGAATISTSSVSMIVCCLHHVTDFLPILGLSGFFLFASEMTGFFLAIGIASNMIGIASMLAMLQKNNQLVWKPFSIYNWVEIRNALMVLSIIGVVAFGSFMVAFPNGSSNVIPNGTVNLSTKIDQQQNVEVEVTPRLSENQTAFEIKFTTHQGDLDFEIDRIATLTDSTGKKLNPIKWDGSPPGGHHRSGTLYFESVAEQASTIALTLSNVAGVDRVFSWKLN